LAPSSLSPSALIYQFVRADPLMEHKMSISKNQIYAGTVVKITDFGVLVGITGEYGVGLVHRSQLAGNSVNLRKNDWLRLLSVLS